MYLSSQGVVGLSCMCLLQKSKMHNSTVSLFSSLFPHLPLPRPLVISLLLLTNATSQAMTERDCLEGFCHSCAFCCSAANSSVPPPLEMRDTYTPQVNYHNYSCYIILNLLETSSNGLYTFKRPSDPY